jgi:hypothetical protein
MCFEKKKIVKIEKKGTFVSLELELFNWEDKSDIRRMMPRVAS